MLLFTADAYAAVAAGEITVTWRLWKYAHVKAGRYYSSGFGQVFVEDVRLVRAADLREEDAHEAGLGGVSDLIELVRRHTGAAVEPDTTLYRVQFHYAPGAPLRAPVLSLDELRARLDRLDRSSRHGEWTLETLRLIEANPWTLARLLAAAAGRPVAAFKLDVRKLKDLGLTVSGEVGYELSELGQSYLDSLEEGEDE